VHINRPAKENPQGGRWTGTERSTRVNLKGMGNLGAGLTRDKKENSWWGKDLTKKREDRVGPGYYS